MREKEEPLLQVQKLLLGTSEILHISFFIKLHTQHPALKYSNQLAPIPLHIWWLCDLQRHGLCLSYTLYQFPYCSCLWMGLRLDPPPSPSPCFSEMFGRLSYGCGQLACSTESCPEQQALTVVLSTTMTAPLCRAMLSHFLSLRLPAVDPNRARSCCVFQPAHCYCRIYLASHLSAAVPFTSLTLLLQLFPSASSRSFNLSEVLFWGRAVVIGTARSFREESCISTPSAAICEAKGSHSQLADASDEVER